MGQVVEEGELGVDTKAGQDEVIGLCRREGRDDELALPGIQQREGDLVVGIGGVDGGVQRARVDDQRGDRPSSRRTISSAWRAIASPLPRPAPAERRRLGGAAAEAVASAIASRMISACERPVSAAILRSAAASRSPRYTVVFTTNVWYQPWAPARRFSEAPL